MAGRFRVAMLSPAARAPGENAITDYADRLSDALASVGVDLVHIRRSDWGLRTLRTIRAEVDAAAASLLHIQHPISFRSRSLTPQLLSLLRPAVVTTHGGSLYGRVGEKASLGMFYARPRHVVFTTAFERQHALSWAPWLRGKSSVIPIGANLPALPSEDRAEDEIVSFGLLRPGKGLEDVLALASLADGRWRVRIVGEVPVPDDGYAARLRGSSAGLPVDWNIGLDSVTAARVLGQARFAYLPFPDGASERRGSLLACLAAGCAVVTTDGNQVPAGLRDAVAFAASPAEALRLFDHLSAEPAVTAAMASRGQSFAARSSWESIAAAHATLYSRLLAEA